MSNKKVIVGFMIGAAAGAIAGILFAPDKGSSTRKKIAGKAGDITDSIKDSFSKFVDTVKGKYHDAEEEAEELSEKAGAKMSAAKKEVKQALS
ncbi:MAG: YtxH domain-containing protein [Chitinophagaceae bacterium]